MTTARVILRKKSNPAVYVQADLSLRVAPVTRVESRLGEAPQQLHLLDGSVHPSHVPAEATTYSGALFALRKLNAIHGPGDGGDLRYVLTIDRLSGVYQPEDVEGFAHAGLIGVAHMTGRADTVTEDVSADWELESCSVKS
jgi:hypothetical protein